MDKDFNKNFNISYVDETVEKPSNLLVLKHYVASVAIYLIVYIIINNNPFFIKQLNSQLNFFYLTFLCLYIVAAPIFLYCIKPKSIHKSHSIAIMSYFIHLFKDVKFENFYNFDSVIKYLKPTYHQLQAFALMSVKVFFGTLMVSGLYNNVNIIAYRLHDYTIFLEKMINLQGANILEFVKNNCNFIFFNLVLILFTIDLLIFSVGYLTELSCLKNKIRSIDTSVAGVFLCLCCYPPFNNVTTAFLGWNQNDASYFFGDEGHILTILFRFIAIIFLAIYVLASIALGTKASNLTNRGTVSKFPYNIVRHPAYISKILFWFLTTIPIFFGNGQMTLSRGFCILLSVLAWTSIYYLRALTEERHLSKDPEYQEYVAKVKYRFIPYIF